MKKKLTSLYLMSGAPGSGKTTWAKKFAEENENVVYISKDEIRTSLLKEGEFYFSHEKETFCTFITLAKNALKENKTVLLDASHLNWIAVHKTLYNLDWISRDYTIVRMNLPIEILYERNAARSGRSHVPEAAIKEMYDKMDDPTQYCKNVIFIEV